LAKADGDGVRSVRDLAMLSVLVGCGLRRADLSALTVEDLQIRQGHWAIVDLVGKRGHVRTVPMPAWVKAAVDRWRESAKVTTGRYLGCKQNLEQPVNDRFGCLFSRTSVELR